MGWGSEEMIREKILTNEIKELRYFYSILYKKKCGGITSETHIKQSNSYFRERGDSAPLAREINSSFRF